MHLKKILLQNFRSYDQKLLEFSSKSNLIIGPNGSGKSNILESIYLLSTAKSFRSSSISQMIAWNQNLSSVRGKVIKKKQESEVEVQLIKNQESPTNSVKRRFLIDKVPKPRKIFLTCLNTVVFNPEDIRLVNGSPTRRRDFLDNIFTQIDWKYNSSLSQYHKALKHRNELLDLIRTNRASANELFYWDQSLVKNAAILYDLRLSFFNSANSFFLQNDYPEVKGLSLKYQPSILTLEKLNQNLNFDIQRGHTQFGPHRDDFIFEFSLFSNQDKNLAFWGSRGQQRLAVLAIKLAEIHFLLEFSGSRPVLLLDDIFSELDSDHQKLVTDICRNYQTIITSSDPQTRDIIPESNLIKLE